MTTNVLTAVTGWQMYAKAIVGALIAFLSGVASGLSDGKLSWQEIIYSVIAGLVALGVVWGVPNKSA